MILYQSTSKEFIDIVESNQIIPRLESEFKDKLGRKLPTNELSAYLNSLPYMARVVRRANIAEDCGILIEYIIRNTSNRIDFLIAGEDLSGGANLIIVELKQWQSAEATKVDGIVRTFIGGSIKETTHPSYQAQSYKHFMSDFSEDISIGNIRAYSCACLHNYPKNSPEPLLDSRYLKIVEEAPIFFRDDQEKLEHFLSKYVKKGNGSKILYKIESGTIRPTKKLIDHVSELFKGNQQFVLLDEQKVAFEMARAIAKETSKKSVVIIKGGPGTGKSVISVNLLGQLLKDKLNGIFIAPNASFRNVIIRQLAQNNPIARVRNLFKGSGQFVNAKPNTFDVMIVDEAHRLKKQGAYMYQGFNQVADIIKASKTAIFFIDDDQVIRPEDIGSVSEIKRIAEIYKSEIYEIELSAQFRCSGAEGYINWLNDFLQLKQTANFDGWENGDFEFKVFDDPNKLRHEINKKQVEGHTSRMLAGYAWKWSSLTEGNANSEVDDIVISEFDFMMPWNSRSVGTTWAIDHGGINQVGCIHTSQGLEFDYVGIIIGADLTFNAKTLEFSTNFDAYKDAMGKRGLRDNPKELNRLVRNIYKVLMTRGMKGCYVYCVDKELEAYLKSRIKPAKSEKNLYFKINETEKSDLFFSDVIPKGSFEKHYLPIYDLQAVATTFTEQKPETNLGWKPMGNVFKLNKDMFIVQVKGKSMEPAIADGSWCLFSFNPHGSRNGKIVLAESKYMKDPETERSYTIKYYYSEKIAGEDDDTFRHSRIILRPANKSFEDIIFENIREDEFRVVAEFIRVLG